MARREKILAAAAELFAERGYLATGMDDVGEAAGITGGAVYRHFDSKLDLFRAVLEPMVKGRLERVAAIMKEAHTPKRTLELLVENMIDAILEDRSISAAIWRELRHLDVRGSSWFDRAHALNIGLFADTLRRIRPDLTAAEAEAKGQAFFGLAFSAAEFERPLPREELKRLLVQTGVELLLA